MLAMRAPATQIRNEAKSGHGIRMWKKTCLLTEIRIKHGLIRTVHRIQLREGMGRPRHTKILVFLVPHLVVV